EGTTVAILSLGTRLQESLKAAEALAARGVSATVADARFAKPLDVDLILRLAREHEALITVEEGAMGGSAAAGLRLRAGPGARDGGLKIPPRHLPDISQDQDAPFAQYEAAGLTASHIAAAALQALGVEASRAARACGGNPAGRAPFCPCRGAEWSSTDMRSLLPAAACVALPLPLAAPAAAPAVHPA